MKLEDAMSDEFFESSDSVRHRRPLAHAQTLKLAGPLKLELGGELADVEVTFETYGHLNDARDNAVLICHALSGDSHVAAHDDGDAPGWWDIVVGPGKCIDTDRYFVICPNILGGCRGTTGPSSTNPATGKPYGRDFPTITVGDIVEVQLRLIDHLGIDKLRAAIGGSLGGQQVLQWAARHSDRLRGAIPIAACCRLTSQSLAFDIVGRNAILNDPNFRDGQYYQDGPGPNVGLAIARMLGHVTYLSREAMKEKFDAERRRPRNVATDFEQKFAVGSYLAYKGDRFVGIFDANSYLVLSMAMDLFDLGGTSEEIAEVFRGSRCRWLVVSFSSDWLFPPDQSRQIVDGLIATDCPVTYCNVTSNCGHDAFLLAQDLHRYGELVRSFLANLDAAPATGGRRAVQPATRERARGQAPSRPEYELILQLSEPAHSILDLGCGDGELLDLLRRRGHERVMGLEIDEDAILACARRGLDVIHGDLNQGLGCFRDGQFDFVLLSLTLQVIKDVEGLLTDMLRVGRQSVVTFPNFAYRKLRKMYVEQGRAPESAGLLKYKWYNTPNIRFFTVADFEDYCMERGILIRRRLTLDTETGMEINDDPNLDADLAIFVISRG